MPAKKRTLLSKQRNHSHDPAVYALLQHLVADLPGVEEGLSYGTPAFKVGKQLFARLHQDGESLVVKLDLLRREVLLNAAPEMFYLTDHYLNYPYILVRLAKAPPDKLKEILEQAWRLVAPAKLIEAFERGKNA